MGSTMIADSTPWAAPESTFSTASSQIGQGACTRSSISRVKPNSWAMASAIDCTRLGGVPERARRDQTVTLAELLTSMSDSQVGHMLGVGTRGASRASGEEPA
jgi:hypothetical protein